jgi:hypothetical protein
MFADDTNAGSEIGDFNNNDLTILQSDLKEIEQWAKKWLVTFNPSKTECVIFDHNKKHRQQNAQTELSFMGEQITIVEEHKHLGVILADDLSWESNVQETCIKGRRKSNILRTFKTHFSRDVLKKMYNSQVKSTLCYGDILYPKPAPRLIKMLEDIQYSSMLTICGAHRGTSAARMREELDLLPLSEIRINHSLVYIYKMVNEITPNYLNELLPDMSLPLPTGTYNFRRNTDLRDPEFLTFDELPGHKYTTDSCLAIAIKKWNLLPLYIKVAPSVDNFKSLIKVYSLGSIHDRSYFSIGKREISSLHCRLRLGTNELNESLFTRNLHHTPLCECGEIESVEHFLLNCPRYSHPRKELFQKIDQLGGLENGFTFNILSKKIKMVWLLRGNKDQKDSWNAMLFLDIHKFIKDSKRFKLKRS